MIQLPTKRLDRALPLEPAAARRHVLGDIIWAGRNLTKHKYTGKIPTQAEFYALCRKQENPPMGKRAGVLFGEASANSRRWMSAVENGTETIEPGHARIFEKVIGWPDGVLDEVPSSYEAFWPLLDGWADRGAKPLRLEPFPERQVETDIGERQQVVDLKGISTLAPGHIVLGSRAKLAREIEVGLKPDPLQPLRIVVLQGEQGIGKSELIAEWWNAYGKKNFNRTTYTLNCATSGGDVIVTALNTFFLSKPTAQLTPELAERLARLPRLLIVLDNLSYEEGDPRLSPDDDTFDLGVDDDGRPADKRPGQSRQPSLTPASRADPAAFHRVREIVLFLAKSGVRASLLLGVQTAEQTRDVLQLSRRLDASTQVDVVNVGRLSTDESVQLFQNLGVRNISLSDLRKLSERLQGLPISIVAAAHVLRTVDETQAEAFLAGIADGGSFEFFEDLFGHYLASLNGGDFNPQAHPHAYLRLLALMPGPVPKIRLDKLLTAGRIHRLQKASVEGFARMRLPFLSGDEDYIDINPMLRSLLRQDLARRIRRSQPGSDDRAEIRWIHITAALDCHRRLPTPASDFTVADIETIEGVLYHLLAVRDVLDAPATGVRPDEDLAALADLLKKSPSPAAITEYCLESIIRPYLMDRRTHRSTRILGQFETKARLLGLFFDSVDEAGNPRHLDLWDQIDLYGEIGVCWMHAGRLKLASDALGKAMGCFQTLGLKVDQDSFPLLNNVRLRLWSETLSTHVLVMMRMGRDHFTIDAVLTPAAEVGARYAKAVLALDGPLDDHQKATLRSARRLLYRDAHVKLRTNDLVGAHAGYELAIALGKLGGDKLSGDALRRRIEVLVRRGPCLPEDLVAAEALIDRQLEPRRDPAALRRGSNDVIGLYATKIMLRRAQGDFVGAGEILQEAQRHPFFERGECSYAARVELELERYRLLAAQQVFTSQDAEELELLIKELEERHHATLHVDATLILAETLPEPLKSQALRTLDRQQNYDGWHLRRRDIETLLNGRSAVMTWGA